MIKLTTQQLAQIFNASLIGDGQVVVENINTDTRKALSNSLFFALKGEHFDAHPEDRIHHGDHCRRYGVPVAGV